jgi:ribosomal protein S18 acetylase RimI-like enzyme
MNLRMVTVRSFQLSDYAPLTKLFNEVLSELCYEETMEAFGRQLSWDSDMVLVATHKQAVVGAIIGTIDDNKAYYYRIAVASDYQRKGIGRSLIEGLKKRFEQRKVKQVLVTLDTHNEKIVPFYESLGFGQTDFQRSARKLSIVCG